MKAKHMIIPVLVVALIGMVAAPPAQAELVTVTVILAVAFASAIIANETMNSEPESETVSQADNAEPVQQASTIFSEREPVRP